MRYQLLMFRRGQTHPAPLAQWKSDDRKDLIRIASLNKQDGMTLTLIDTETGENIYL
jgi:hypothetical protein